MQYFLPFWPGDKIHERFSPWKEIWEGNELRIWESFDKPPIDGVLVSRVNIESSNFLRKEAENRGIHSALRFKGTVMGDCGAYSYLNETDPPYDAIETLAFYKRLGFDIGVTVDHLIVKTINQNGVRRVLSDAERRHRWKRTISNAKKMFDEYQKSDYEKMRLIGVTQGWDPTSYVNGVRELVEYGFNYIGLGGLARKPTHQIKAILLAAKKYLRHLLEHEKKRVVVHLFGITREKLFPLMRETGVVSFDSASPLRCAWLSATKNYRLKEDYYTAIRFPIRKDKYAEEMFRSLRKFETNKIEIDEFLKMIHKYDPKRLKMKENDYRKTLAERPWTKCGCPICKALEIHVCVFRMNERNMRRGFHNVYQLHKDLRSKYPRYLAFTMCTAKKDQNPSLLPAYKRYSASTIFRTFWKNVYDLPVELGILSAKYFLIKWDAQIPNYDVKLSKTDLDSAKRDLSQKLQIFDKIFFIGLGVYRQIVEHVVEEVALPAEIFPKSELTLRGKLDLIEYQRQMKFFRESIVQNLSSSKVKHVDLQPVTLTDFAQK